jgi:hypothetical protein
MWIVQVWRPEACSAEEEFQPHAYKPFAGVEILGVVETEAEVNAMIDKAQATMEPKPETWKFHYEELPAHIQQSDPVFTHQMPSHGVAMPRHLWLDRVAAGTFVDGDGFVYPVKNGKTNRQVITPSQAEQLPADATHVLWFNT